MATEGIASGLLVGQYDSETVKMVTKNEQFDN
jgi:hypothetical protein